MTLGMEFHDTRLLELVCNPDGSGYLLLHACVYRSEGTVFEDPQESGWQDCRLSFEDMRVNGPRVEPNEYISEGQVKVDGLVHDHVIRLPGNHRGTVEVKLVIAPLFEPLTIQASEMSSSLEGPWALERIWGPDDMAG